MMIRPGDMISPKDMLWVDSKSQLFSWSSSADGYHITKSCLLIFVGKKQINDDGWFRVWLFDLQRSAVYNIDLYELDQFFTMVNRMGVKV